MLIALAFTAALAAAWVLPWRLAFGQNGSYYTFGLIGDEYTYAQRIQPLIPGTARSNPVNGICDPQIISEYYLEDACRACVVLTGFNAITFVWAWRVVFPLALAVAMATLAHACLRRRRPWSRTLCLAAGAAAFSLLYSAYDLVTCFPPLQGWLHRFPTNVEYPLSALAALVYLRFLEAPGYTRGVALALTGAALVYLRPYLAMGWGLAYGAGLIYLFVKRELRLRVSFAVLVTLCVALAPWLLIRRWNEGSAVYAEMLHRYFVPRRFFAPTGYRAHPLWLYFVCLAAVLSAAGAAMAPRFRPFAFSCALAMTVLPFVSCLFVFGFELLNFDRFGSFYFVALSAVGMLALRERALKWRGHGGAAKARRWAAGLALCSVLGAGTVVARNAAFDLPQYDATQLPSILEDLPCVPAYDWVRQHTPPEAFFLVDDGYDWSVNTKRNDKGQVVIAGLAPDGTSVLLRDDLFQLVARRRRVHSERLYGNALATADVIQLGYLQRGAFGLPVQEEDYAAALKRFRPTHVFWRRKAPVPRGYGAKLRRASTVVFTNEACEVWELGYPAVLELFVTRE